MRLSIFAAALLLVGVTLQASPGQADQKDDRLPALFEALTSHISLTQAKLLEHQIWSIWHIHENDQVNNLMRDGKEAMETGRYKPAVWFFEEITKADPDFAEGWNKLATIHFLMGNYEQSIEDVDKTLKLEPRHFGALAGLGHNFLALGNPEAAIRAYEKALAVNPYMDSLRIRLDQLRAKKEDDAT